MSAVTLSLAQTAQDEGPEVLLANATPYLHLVGHTVVATLWLQQVAVAEGREGDFFRGKEAAARYFYAWELPKTAHWAGVLSPVDRTCLDLQDSWL